MQGEDASGVLEASRNSRHKSTSSTSTTEPKLDSADWAEITHASKVAFASKGVRGKLKKCEVEFRKFENFNVFRMLNQP